MNTVHVTCTSVIIALFISTVYSIKCFQCSSFVDSGCADVKTNETTSPYLKDCEQHEHHQVFCRKTTQKLTAQPEFLRITRSCGWIFHKTNDSNCRNADSDFKKERTCQCFTDACNSALTTRPPPLIIAGVAASLLFYRFL